MPAVTHYRSGVPSWADVGLADVPAGAAFYSALFGWDAEDMGEEAGHYTMFSIDGASVAAAGPRAEGAPSAWSAYVSVDDLDAALAQVEPAGGQVLLPRTDIFTSGSMAVVADPAGAALSLWQPGDHIGAERVNERHTLAWHELNSRDLPAATAFYSAVLGWTYELMEGPPGQDPATAYHLVKVGDRIVGGAMAMEGDEWGDMPSHWMVYFAVDDCDAAAERAKELGGSVGVEPFDIPIGRFSVLADPEGAHFTVMAFANDLDDIPDGTA